MSRVILHGRMEYSSPPPQRRDKSTCIQAFLCKWFVPSKTHDLTFVMDYEILEKE